MALTILKSRKRRSTAGGYRVSGIAKFTGNGASGELDTNGLKRLDAVALTPIGAPATDETLYVDEDAQVVGGQLSVPATNSITVARTGTPTADLKFAFELVGQ